MDTEGLMDLARRDGQHEAAAYNAFSGTDVVEAPFYMFRRRFWVALASGESFATAYARLDVDWRQYAAENNAKVASAPRIKRGPRRGQSSMEHRWVSPEKAESCLPFLHTMAGR